MKKTIIRYLIRHLIRWISVDDVLVFDRNGVKHKGKYLTNDQVDRLSEQAKTLKDMYLWKVLSDEIKYAAYLHWLEQGEDISTRALIRADEIIQKTIDKLSKLK